MTETPHHITRDMYDKVARAERIAKRMDAALRLPGTRIRFGWDSVLGLVPGIGDTLALSPSVYIVYLAHSIGVPKSTLLRMAGNIGVDWLIGIVPFVGDIFDVGFKSNLRNAGIMRQHVERQAKAKPRQRASGSTVPRSVRA